MKKFIVLIFGVFLCSCTKMSMEANNEFSEISFNINILEGTSFTKSIVNNEVISAIRETFPTFYYIKLTNTKNGNVYEMKSNETKYIPNGEYKVENFYKIENSVENVGVGTLSGPDCNPKNSMCVNPGYGVCKYPKIVINDIITINNSQKINLNGIIKCYAFVYDNTTTDYVNFVKYDNYKIECENKKGDFSFFFCWAYDNGNEYWMGFKCIAKENKGVETTYYSLDVTPNKVLYYGKYYVLKCNNIENAEISNEISVSNFIEGEELTDYIK